MMAFRKVQRNFGGLINIRKALFSVDVMKLQMPALSPTMAEGIIA